MKPTEISTAEEIYNLFQDKDYLGLGVTHHDRCIHAIQAFAEFHVKAALEAAAEIADNSQNIAELTPSILNAYPLDNIK